MGRNAYTGKYKLKHPEKFYGDPTKLQYKSLLERRFMRFCDSHPSVLQWAYEKVIIPYLCETDHNWHKYYIDFWIRKVNTNKETEDILIEIKPYSETVEPERNKKSKKTFLNETLTWVKNSSKWSAARKFAEKNNIKFMVITDKDLAAK